MSVKGVISTKGKIHGAVVVRGETGESAYEYAVSKGYTGTESQFAQAQYDSATQIPSLSAEIEKLKALGLFVDADGDVAQHDYI